MNIEKTVKNLEGRGFKVTHFANGAEAAEYIEQEVKGCTVGMGGSMTLKELGLYEKLEKDNTVYWHWIVPGAETLKNAQTADVYLSSANAVSEDGEILAIDGNGNRVSSLLFGHKKVYIVVGTNKICPDFDTALYRARNEAAVKNGARLNKKTPCQLDGKCHDCRSADRICRGLVVLWMAMNGMETEVVLIDESLGM